MRENPYDNPVFFEKYSRMDRSQRGLEAAGEWDTLEAMLPDFSGKRVLDLGCGYGWHCRYALEQGAAAVTGIDISEKMLAEAKKRSAGLPIAYSRCAIEDAAFPPGSFDIVLSSLSLHYVADYAGTVEKVREWLSPGGVFIFSAEHPLFTAEGSQDWYYGEDGRILHFPVDRYFYEGEREACFLGETVKKQHRTLTTYLRTLLEAGLQITGFAEPIPPRRLLDTAPGMADELRRPMMCIIRAEKPGKAD